MGTVTELDATSEFVLGVAANVRAEAARRGISQLQLATRIGLSQSATSVRWRGRRQWQLADLDAVARVLGTTPSELCRVDPEQRPRRDSNAQPTVYRSDAGQDDDPRAVVIPFPMAGVS